MRLGGCVRRISAVVSLRLRIRVSHEGLVAGGWIVAVGSGRLVARLAAGAVVSMMRSGSPEECHCHSCGGEEASVERKSMYLLSLKLSTGGSKSQ